MHTHAMCNVWGTQHPEQCVAPTGLPDIHLLSGQQNEKEKRWGLGDLRVQWHRIIQRTVFEDVDLGSGCKYCVGSPTYPVPTGWLEPESTIEFVCACK